MEEKILGDYILIKQIGQGSLGTVHLAEHRFIKKQYIIKILPPELAADRGFVQRFQEDISILATLDHPHIVKVHNVSFSDGIYFLITDCIVDEIGETTNLAQYMASLNKPLTEQQLLHILMQIASALDYIHTKKIADQALVHRGLKLNNILISKINGEVKASISDCGLSRIIGSGGVLSRTYKALADALAIAPYVTSTNKNVEDRYSPQPVDTNKLSLLHASFLQNYAFLAPEQKKLTVRSITPKVDSYAFGILIYYLITSHFPEGVFEFPSAYNADYRFNWDGLIHSCLQSNPDKRPLHLKEALEKYLCHTSQPTQQIAAAVINNAAEYEELLPIEENRHYKTESMLAHAQVGGFEPILRQRQLEKPQYDPHPECVFQIDSTVKQYHPKYEEAKNIEPLLTNMEIIAGGRLCTWQ